MISAKQIRAARSLLDWTQGALAKKSGLSLRALHSIEREMSVPRPDNILLIQQTLEKAGIEFGEYEGVRYRTERLEVLRLEGARYIDQHLIDAMQELRGPGEVLFQLPSEEPFQDVRSDVLDEYFQHIARHGIGERLLIARGETHVIGPPHTYRWFKRSMFNHVSFIVYGDNVAFQILKTPHRMIILRNPGIAEMFRNQFEANWVAAEVPWFASRYKREDSATPWSMAKANAAQAWIAHEKEKRKP